MFPISLFHQEHRDKDRPRDDRLLRLHEAKKYISQWHDIPVRDLLKPVARILKLPVNETTYNLLLRIHINNDMLELVEEITMEIAS